MNDSFSQIETNKLTTLSDDKRFHTCDESDKTFTKDTLNITADYNRGKLYLDTINEKKSYENKIQALNNRIKKLEQQEREINKQTGKLKEKYILEQKIKSDKIENKDLVINTKKYTEFEIEKRKKEIEDRRNKRKQIAEKISQDHLFKNKKNYENAKQEKIFWESINQDIRSHNSNMKNYKYLKIKQEFVENKAGRYKSQIEREEKIKHQYEKKVKNNLEEKENLKEKLKKLEEKELEYISKLKHTVLLKQEEFESFKTKNMNSSMMDISTNKPSSNRVKNVKCSSLPKLKK